MPQSGDRSLRGRVRPLRRARAPVWSGGVPLKRSEPASGTAGARTGRSVPRLAAGGAHLRGVRSAGAASPRRRVNCRRQNAGAVTAAFSTCCASLTPPANPRSWNCRVGRPGTRIGSAHAASRSIFLRRSCAASRQATAVPATLVSRARSSRGISRWSANTMRESNSSP